MSLFYIVRLERERVIDWSKPGAVEDYKQAGIAYRAYIAASKKSNYKRYVSFDLQKRTMSITTVKPPYTSEMYPLGELLFAFADLNLTEYEHERQETLRLLRDPHTDYYKVGCYIGHMGNDRVDIEYNQLVCADRFIKRFQALHPYLLVFDSDYVTLHDHDAICLLENELNLVKLQREIIYYIELCLNEQVEASYSQLPPIKRYALHARTTARLPLFTNHSTLYFRAVNGPDAKPSRQIAHLQATADDLARVNAAQSFDDIAERPFPDETAVNKTAASEYVAQEGYAVQTARDMAMLELSRMILTNTRVRKCGYCGRYFMPNGMHDTKYCATIPEGQTRNCQTLGAQRDFREKTRSEVAYSTYRTFYKRLNWRMNQGLMTREQFTQWQGNAQRQLELCKAGEIMLEQFKKWMDENSTRHVPK